MVHNPDLIAVSGHEYDLAIVKNAFRLHPRIFRYRGHGGAGGSPDDLHTFVLFFELIGDEPIEDIDAIIEDALGDSERQITRRYYYTRPRAESTT